MRYQSANAISCLSAGPTYAAVVRLQGRQNLLDSSLNQHTTDHAEAFALRLEWRDTVNHKPVSLC